VVDGCSVPGRPKVQIDTERFENGWREVKSSKESETDRSTETRVYPAEGLGLISDGQMVFSLSNEVDDSVSETLR